MLERTARQNELVAYRRQCSLDCFPVTVYDHCESCGENTVQCLTHRWKVKCRCEREYEDTSRTDAFTSTYGTETNGNTAL